MRKKKGENFQAPTKNVITAQEYHSREDMSLVLQYSGVGGAWAGVGVGD